MSLHGGKQWGGNQALPVAKKVPSCLVRKATSYTPIMFSLSEHGKLSQLVLCTCRVSGRWCTENKTIIALRLALILLHVLPKTFHIPCTCFYLIISPTYYGGPEHYYLRWP